MDGSKRKRARLACKPCRERKRRCDGGHPCATCTEWGYVCGYESRKRQSAPLSPAAPTGSPSVPFADASAPADSPGLVRRLEANSGAAFVRKLGLKMDARRAPKLNLFAWNVGARQMLSGLEDVTVLPVREITSLGDMQALARTYFAKLDPCYGFVDRGVFSRRLVQRWTEERPRPDIYDSVIAGVGVIGCLFSQRRVTATERQLMRAARAGLDDHQLTGPPSMELLTAWTLRCIYLRLTDTPHATWIASATLMHLTEAAGLHPAEAPSALLATAAQQQEEEDLDLQARVVGVAHHLHAWTAFDLGLARVSFRDERLLRLPAPRAGDYTAELLALLPASVRLDPRGSDRENKAENEDGGVMATLARVVEGRHTQPPSVLAQCNLVLCLLRRIHHTPHLPDWPDGLAEQVLTVLQRGLSVIPGLVAGCCPWHQTANVPFQTLCMLLVLDTRASLALLPQALQTLNLVAQAYPTDVLREACRAARLLVLLHQQRRRDDMAVFAAALSGEGDEADVPDESVEVESAEADPAEAETPSAEDYAWVGALVADLPGLQRIDLDDLLTVDMLNDALGGSG